MTEQKSYEHHIQLVLTALNGQIVTLKVIQLTFSNIPTILVGKVPLELCEIQPTELLGYAQSLWLVESDLPLVSLCRASPNIDES